MGKAVQDQLESAREALSKARKEIERERAEMLVEISRVQGELEAARAETWEWNKALNEECQARASAERETVELRAQVATIAERTARTDRSNYCPISFASAPPLQAAAFLNANSIDLVP